MYNKISKNPSTFLAGICYMQNNQLLEKVSYNGSFVQSNRLTVLFLEASTTRRSVRYHAILMFISDHYTAVCISNLLYAISILIVALGCVSACRAVIA